MAEFNHMMYERIRTILFPKTKKARCYSRKNDVHVREERKQRLILLDNSKIRLIKRSRGEFRSNWLLRAYFRAEHQW